jgi:hypothetical protein
MKTSHVEMLALAVLVPALSIAGVVFSQVDLTNVVPKLKKDHVVQRSMPADGVAAEPLANIVKVTRADDETQKIAAAALRTQAVPPSRAAYFASILNDPQYHFRFWASEILEVQDIDGTKTVKVRTTPAITAGAAATVTGALDETYELTGDSLKLLKSEPSHGSAEVGVLTD